MSEPRCTADPTAQSPFRDPKKPLWDPSTPKPAPRCEAAPAERASPLSSLRGSGGPIPAAQAATVFGHYGPDAPAAARTPHGRHRITASPAIAIAVPGTEVRYSVGPEPAPELDGSHYTYHWSVHNDPASSRARGIPEHVAGPPLSLPSWEARWDFPGTHKVICRVQRHRRLSPYFELYSDEAPEYLEYQQTVRSQSEVLSGAFAKAPLPADPQAQLAHLRLYAETLRAAERQPGSARLAPEAMERLDEHLQNLGHRLQSSEGHRRHPIRAVHLATASAQTTPLNVFASCIARRDGEETWALVDLTNPSDRRLTGEYHGSGPTAREALEHAVAAWERGNRYPQGVLRLQIPDSTGAPLSRDLATDGASFWDSLAEFFHQVGLWSGLGMLGLALTATAAPDGTVSKLAAALLWTSILASTTGTAIGLVQRHAEGLSTGGADALDAVSIAGNILGARWLLGATVKGLGLAGSRMGTAIVIGRIGTDAAQGVLLSTEYAKEYHAILQDPDPQRRTDQLLRLLSSALVSGGLLLLSMHASRADLAKLGAEKATLSKLAQPGAVVDLAATPAPPTGAAGRVNEPVSGLYQSVGEHLGEQPPGWQLTDQTPATLSQSVTGYRTDVTDPQGRTGHVIRNYDSQSRSLSMQSAFFDDQMERWINVGVPLVRGKGTPAVTYLTLRQLHQAGVGYGGLKTVKMSMVQNVDTVLHVEQLRRQGLEFEAAVAKTHSVRYAETLITQSGHRIVGLRVDLDGAWVDPVERILSHSEIHPGLTPEQRAFKLAKHEALLAKYGLTRADRLWVSYDIYFDLAPLAASAP